MNDQLVVLVSTRMSLPLKRKFLRQLPVLLVDIHCRVAIVLVVNEWPKDLSSFSDTHAHTCSLSLLLERKLLKQLPGLSG